jgi:hypothetical protein
LKDVAEVFEEHMLMCEDEGNLLWMACEELARPGYETYW